MKFQAMKEKTCTKFNIPFPAQFPIRWKTLPYCHEWLHFSQCKSICWLRVCVLKSNQQTNESKTNMHSFAIVQSLKGARWSNASEQFHSFICLSGLQLHIKWNLNAETHRLLLGCVLLWRIGFIYWGKKYFVVGSRNVCYCRLRMFASIWNWRSVRVTLVPHLNKYTWIQTPVTHIHAFTILVEKSANSRAKI